MSAELSTGVVPESGDGRNEGRAAQRRSRRQAARRAPAVVVEFPGGADTDAALVPLPHHPRKNANMVDEERWDPGNYDPLRLFAEALIENERAARPGLKAPKLAKLLRGLGLKVSAKQVRTMASEIKVRHKAATTRAKQRAREHTHHPVPWEVVRREAE